MHINQYKSDLATLNELHEESSNIQTKVLYRRTGAIEDSASGLFTIPRQETLTGTIHDDLAAAHMLRVSALRSGGLSDTATGAEPRRVCHRPHIETGWRM